MAGIMNKECFALRPLLVENLLLGTPMPEEVSRHLGQCPDCTREAHETQDVVRTLRRADPLAGWTPSRASDAQAGPSSDLGDRIRRDVARAKTARPGRRRIVLGVAAAFVAAAAVVVPLSMGQDQHRAPDTSVSLVRQGQMVERPWGTEVPVALSGLETGRTYRVMTVNAEGARVPGGSVRAAADGRPVTIHMVTAMRKNTITALLVEDEEGHVVTQVSVRTSRPS